MKGMGERRSLPSENPAAVTAPARADQYSEDECQGGAEYGHGDLKVSPLKYLLITKRKRLTVT